MLDIGTLFFGIWWLLPLFLLVILFKSPWFKGRIGEAIVNISASCFLNKNDYHLFKNVTIQTEDGTTQIDHIIVSCFGVFVVETKNLKGWIFGSEHQKMWTQQLYRSKYKFQNPLHQNYKHTKTLELALDLPADKLISIIVFVGDSVFKTAMPENVTYGRGYIRFIKSHNKPMLSKLEVDRVIQKITDDRLKPSIKTHIEHAQHAKNIVAEKQAMASVSNMKLCPKCGSNMVLRTAKKGLNAGGQFWGCSAFPKCKTILAIE